MRISLIIVGQKDETVSQIDQSPGDEEVKTPDTKTQTASAPCVSENEANADGSEASRLADRAFAEFFGTKRFLPSLRTALSIALGASLCVILLGCLLSLFLHEWLWLSRSGGLCVVIGTSMVLYDVSGYYDRTLRGIQRTKLLLGSVLRARFDDLLANPALPADVRSEVQIHRDKALHSVEQMSSPEMELAARQEQQDHARVVRIAEVSILIVGTLLWAFGDLLNNIYR